MRMRMIAPLVAVAVALPAFVGACTVIPIGHESEYTGRVAFDAASEVDTIWHDMALVEVPEKAVDLASLLRDASGDLRAPDMVERYGGKDATTSESAAYNAVVYAVRGTGTVAQVVAKAADPAATSKGYLVVSVDGYEGGVEVRLAVGPVISDTSIRDYLSGISLNDFKDTTEWSSLSKEINVRVGDDVVSAVDVASLEGKRISFSGCFTANAAQMPQILVVPVELQAA